VKVNLGAGYKRFDGFVNVDDDPLTKPEYLVDLEAGKLPFEDNSVDEMICSHILEHIWNFIPLMQEIHRVCKHGAIINIVSPYHLHDIQFIDPTHKRFITVEGMRLFSQKFNQECIDTQGSSSGLGLKFNINFEIVAFDFNYDSFYTGYLADYKKRKEEGTTTPEEDFAYVRLHREAFNFAMETKIILVVIKDDAAA
jgi:SAM-dependent methyltransferase